MCNITEINIIMTVVRFARKITIRARNNQGFNLINF